MRSSTVRNLSRVALFAAVACGSCAETKERGQLLVSFQTDMEVPKDVSAVRVQILSFGASQHDETYPVGPDGVKLPATLGVLEGSNPSAPVTIRVTALQGDTARVLREAVTTVPPKRVGLLRMPVQWLCWNEVEPAGDYDVVSTCPEGQTCSAGKCIDQVIDSATLPTYTPEAVFGGESGTCFDTVACFADGAGVAVDVDTCSIAAPSGGEGTNVALVAPPGSRGICGREVCLVPLDADPTDGYHERDGRILLPPAVCDHLASGDILGVAVTTSCETKTPSVPTCGAWSSVGGRATVDAGAPADVNIPSIPDGSTVADGGLPEASVPDAGPGDGGAVVVNDGGDVLPDGGSDASVTDGLIGPGGGTITFESLTLEIPPGALSEPTAITIGPAAALPPGNLGPAFEVGPTGTQFSVPAKFIYSYDNLDLAGFPPTALRVATVQGGEWVPLDNPLMEPGNAVSGQADHLSPFGLIVQSEGAGEDAGACGNHELYPTVPPGMYLMLESSSNVVNLWPAISDAVNAFAVDPASAGVELALEYFGVENPVLECGGEGFDVPAVPFLPLPGNADAIGAALANRNPTGLNVLEGAIRGGINFTEQLLAEVRYAPIRLVILVGSDANACNTGLSLLSALLMDAENQNPGFRAMFIGISGLVTEATLHSLAAAGGTGQAIMAAGPTAQAIQDALNVARSALKGCEFQYPFGVDPSTLTVSIEPDGMLLTRFLTENQCGASFGYYLDDAAEPSRVILCPQACRQALVDMSRTVEANGCFDSGVGKDAIIH